MHLGTLIATLGVDASGLTAAQARMKAFEAQVQSSVARINARLLSMGKVMMTIGKGMTKYLTLPLLLVGGAAVKMFMDFESSMTKIIGLVGVARKQVEQWSKDIIKLGPAVGKGPKELSDAMFFITSAGVRGAEAMEVLGMASKASASGLGQVKDVADLVTSAMNAYGKETLDAAMATDVLTATVREGKAEADALATSMGMVLPIASNMGVAFHEVGAAVASMTRTGTSAATASMQLRQILASMLKPTQQAEKALWGMKTSSAALRKTIREEGLLAALSDVKDLSEEYGETVMSKVFPNIRALSGVLDIMGANLEDNIDIFESLAKAAGSTEYAFKQASQTVEFKWNAALNSMKSTMTLVGGTLSELLIPRMEGFATKMQKVAKWFALLDDNQKKWIVRIIGIVTVLGPLLTILGKLVAYVLPALNTVIVAKVIPAFNALRLAALANPFTAILAGITALIVVVGVWVKKNREAAQTLEELGMFGEEAEKNTIQQRVALEQLLAIAKDETRTLKERQGALNQINRTNKEYLGDLKLEELGTKKATLAKQNYIAELLRESRVKAAQEKLIELEKEKLDLLVRGGAKELKIGQKIGAILRSQVSNRWAVNKGIEAGNKNYAEQAIRIDQARFAVEEFLKANIKLSDLQKDGGVFEIDDEVMAQAVAIQTAITALRDELEFAANMTTLLGGKFDELGAQTEAYQTVVTTLTRLGMDPASVTMKNYATILKELIELSEGLKQATGDFTGVLSVFSKEAEAMNKKLSAITERGQLMVSFDVDTASLSVWTAELNRLLNMGKGAEDIEVVKAFKMVNDLTEVKNINAFEKALEQVTLQERFLGSGFEEGAASLAIWNAEFNRLIAGGEIGKYTLEQVAQKVKELTEAQTLAALTTLEWSGLLVNVFQGMSNAIADALNSTEGVLKAFGKFFVQFITSMIFKLIAATIAALALAVVLTFIFPGNIGKVFKGLSAATGFGGVFKSGLKSIAGLAEGGTIPPGYPNDTFLARLTSGEKVIPLGQTDGASKTQKIIVEGVIVGEDIYWSNKRAGERLGGI